MHTLRKNKKPTKKIILFAIPVILLVAVGGVLLWRHNKGPAVHVDEPVKYAPATNEEKKATEDHKEDIVNDQKTSIVSDANNQANQSGTKDVTPIITSATSSSIRAYVTGVFEDGGTCTAKFTSGSTTRTKTSEGFANASYTQCAPINLDSGFLSTGDWSVTVTYSSSAAQGTSDAQIIKVN